MKRLTLSFDNGPTPGIAERALDILDRAGIRATFFVIGKKLEDPSAFALMRPAIMPGSRSCRYLFLPSRSGGLRLD
jgi:peptidoglycan/xylan/chitin deacetylase (PgdA/CDA1 family)